MGRMPSILQRHLNSVSFAVCNESKSSQSLYDLNLIKYNIRNENVPVMLMFLFLSLYLDGMGIVFLNVP